MTQVAFKDLTLLQLLDALPYLVAEGNEEAQTYNVGFEATDERVPGTEYWIRIAGAEVSCGEGRSEDEDACDFQIMNGSVDAILAMQVEGISAATNLMIMGYIFPSDIPKAEAWFRLLQVGEAPVVAALAKAGYEVTDTTIPLLAELSL